MGKCYQLWITSFFTVGLVYAQVPTQLQCLDGCTASPAILGRDLTISGCCSFDGRGGGGFLLEGATTCINCINFRSNESVHCMDRALIVLSI